MRNNCSIVRDLIPLYAEDLVSKDTKEFICEHCKSCESCKELLKALADTADEQDTTDNKKEKVWSEIASKERKKKKKKYLLITLASAILVTLAVLGRIFLPGIYEKNFYEKARIYFDNQVTQYDFSYTELTLTKTDFTEDDILAASQAVKKRFEESTDDCKLLRLAYDEKKTTDENKALLNPNHADAIVFVGDYYLYEEPVAGPGTRHRTNYRWFVKKDSSGEWKIIDGGYG